MCGPSPPPPPPPTPPPPPPPSGKPVIITLTVSAKDLYNLSPQPLTNNQGELDSYCSLSDDNTTNPGQIPPGGNLNDYTSTVYAGKTVTWVGANSENDGYRVLINSISNNPAFFASDPPGQSGRVTATLQNNINGVEDTYTIFFTIDPPGNESALSYQLDPKLSGKSN